MPRSNFSSRAGFIFIPEQYYSISTKAIVTEDDGTLTDITPYVLSFGVNKAVFTLTSATVTIANVDGAFVDRWNGGEGITIYAEYGDTLSPTFKLFAGTIDDVKYNLSGVYTIKLTCRQTPELSDIKIIEQFDTALVTDATETIVETHFKDIVTFDPGQLSTDVRYTGNFSYTSGLSAISALAKQGNYDVIIDTDFSVQMFEKGSRETRVDYLNVNTNILSINGFGLPTSNIFNNVIISGKQEDNIILIKNVRDGDSQDDLWQKDLVISDSGIVSMEAISQRADVELYNGIHVENSGSFTALATPELKPGDSVRATAPLCGIDGNVNIRSITFNFTASSGFTSNISVETDNNQLVKLFKDRVDAEQRLTAYSNLNAMTDSVSIYFNEATPDYTYNSCSIVDETLRLTDVDYSGLLISDPVEVPDATVSACELRIAVNYPNQELCTFYASNNGGTSWIEVVPGIFSEFPTVGNSMLFKIEIVGDTTHNPTFDKVCLLYKAEY